LPLNFTSARYHAREIPHHYARLFAHETVHTWQSDKTAPALADPLLSQSLREGVADYLATLVTGEVPQLDRDAWARQRESWLWQELQRDRQAMRTDSESLRNPMASPRFRRWFANYGRHPKDGPTKPATGSECGSLKHTYRGHMTNTLLFANCSSCAIRRRF
jgi:predicted metalloprotease with PDZ domain